MTILGFVEYDGGKLNDLSLEMLTFGRRLAAQLNTRLETILVGEAARPLVDRLPAHGVSAVHLAKHERLNEGYAAEAWAQCVADAMASASPEIVLAAGSDRGSEVMAHVAARSNLPLAANCIEVRPGDPFVVTRQRWGGSLLDESSLKGAVKLLTIAPHILQAEEAPTGEVTLNEFTPALGDKDFRARVTSRVEAAAGKVSLSEAKVVVGGGRGVGSAEGFKVLEELAELMGGAVGCSRAVTSLGWRPHHDQVGQTGARIAPEVYIACGVSGATQHMVGAKGSKHILAINTDPEATIVAKADWAIIGDLHEVVPALSEEIRKVRK
jgi:electron transfer flavoprotein alpha subunit